MRHRVAGRQLGRDSAHRRALYRNLVTDLLRHERIVTTEAKAKEIRPMAERMITLGVRGDLHARRQAGRFIYDAKVVRSLFDDIAPRMRGRPGGYLRITKTEPRRGDGSRMAIIELVDYWQDDTQRGESRSVLEAPAPRRAEPARAEAAAPAPEPAAAAEPEPETADEAEAQADLEPVAEEESHIEAEAEDDAEAGLEEAGDTTEEPAADAGAGDEDETKD